MPNRPLWSLEARLEVLMKCNSSIPTQKDIIVKDNKEKFYIHYNHPDSVKALALG